MNQQKNSGQRSGQEPAFLQDLGIRSSKLKFATSVAYRRTRADIALGDLAERTDIAEERLQAIEVGSDITIAEALRIAHALDMTVGIEPLFEPSPPRRSPFKLRAELLLFAPMAQLGGHMIALDYLSQLPVDEDERFLMDYDTWDWETFWVGGPNVDPATSFVVRFAEDELEPVELAAAADGMTVNEFLRHAALQLASQGDSNLRLTRAEKFRPEAVLAMLRSFREGDPQEQERSLTELMQALDEDRPEGRKLFPVRAVADRRDREPKVVDDFS